MIGYATPNHSELSRLIFPLFETERSSQPAVFDSGFAEGALIARKAPPLFESLEGDWSISVISDKRNACTNNSQRRSNTARSGVESTPAPDKSPYVPAPQTRASAIRYISINNVDIQLRSILRESNLWQSHRRTSRFRT